MPSFVRMTLTLLLLFTSVNAAFAQDDAGDPTQENREGAEQESGDGTETGETVEDQEPASFDELRTEFAQLLGRIRTARNDTSALMTEISALRYRVSEFNDNVPSDESLAIELQLLLWENARGEPMRTLAEHFAAGNPEHPGLRAHWAEYLVDQSRYGKAIEVLSTLGDDAPGEAYIYRAEALMHRNRFDDAVATLDAMPKEGVDGMLLDRAYLLRRDIETRSEGWDKEQILRDAEARADDLPRVEFKTEKGDFLVELYEDTVPNTVANFVSLIEEGYYNGLTFHVVVPGGHVQTGDASKRTDLVSTGQAKVFSIPDEFRRDNPRQHFTGVLSMSNVVPNTGSTQFMIVLRRRAERDGAYTAFGRVLEGMDVVEELEQDDAIISATVVRKREHDYTPVRSDSPTAEPIDQTGSGEESAEDNVADETGETEPPIDDDTTGEGTGNGGNDDAGVGTDD